MAADDEYDVSEAQLRLLLNQSFENILHDILLEVHQEEKFARMQTAILEVEIRAEKLGKNLSSTTTDQTSSEAVETKAAIAAPGTVQLKGNPMKTVKHIRCINYTSQQYCKQEPMIIFDKHDVHGQRKKGVKVKGAQAKAKTKKGKAGANAEGGSPGSNNSDPLTPSSSMPDSFEFKEIDYPAAKCPNRNSHLGDHWKAVNLFATHLNGSCWLRRDRQALREANAKINSTPKDSRANSPKPATTNGVKRKADDDKDTAPTTVKKKQKTTASSSSDLKKSVSTNNTKKSVSGQPSKLREELEDDSGKATPSKIKTESGDTIQVAPKSQGGREMSVDSVNTTGSATKIKLNASSSGLSKKAKSKK